MISVRTPAPGDGRFAEAAVRVEDDRLVPAEREQALGDVAGVVELDLVEEGDRGVGRYQRAVPPEDHDAQVRVQAYELLSFQSELAA